MITLILSAALAALHQPATADPYAGQQFEHAHKADTGCCDKPCCDKEAKAKGDCCADMAGKADPAEPGAHHH